MQALERLAQDCGVMLSYLDVDYNVQRASPEALMGILANLGVELERPEEADEHLAARVLARWRELAEPVAVVWGGMGLSVDLRLPATEARRVLATLTREDGRQRVMEVAVESLPVVEEADFGGARFVRRRLPIPGRVPDGYHRLTLELGERSAEVLVIAAPERALSPQRVWGTDRAWGVFMPLYALPSTRAPGVATYTDLERLSRWVGEQGGELVGTLPLGPMYAELPFKPSPYSPASRLFWSDLFVDPSRAPELARCAEARALLEGGLDAELKAMAADRLVDYRQAHRVQRRVLSALAQTFFEEGGHQRPEFQKFLASHPQVQDYARFRASVEGRAATWADWPEPWRGGQVPEVADDDEALRYHLYAQHLASSQIARVGAGGKGASLYLDLAVGVDFDSYDVWRNQEIFALRAGAGAPPDTLFRGGQNWGCPPMIPEALRRTGYRYFIDVLRHHMGPASALRIDHVMCFHRLFWIPAHFPATQGVYVQYNADELFAVATLESHRNRCALVGEDLGTVPVEIIEGMRRHDVQKLYVVQYEANAQSALKPVPEASVASINTHDMPPMAAYLSGSDTDERLALGLIDEDRRQLELRERAALREALADALRKAGVLEGEATAGAVIRACLRYMASSPARALLVNLEDLWEEHHPQNIPGTWLERPNWRHKAALTLDEILDAPSIAALIDEVDRRRRGAI